MLLHKGKGVDAPPGDDLHPQAPGSLCHGPGSDEHTVAEALQHVLRSHGHAVLTSGTSRTDNKQLLKRSHPPRPPPSLASR